MKTRYLLADMALTMLVTFVVAAVVTFLYSLVAHGSGVVDWDTAVTLAVVFGIVLPVTRGRGEERRAA